MDQAIHATVTLELTGAQEAPGVVEGGILNQEVRELNIEALPGDIPDSIVHDVSGLQMNETLTLDVLSAPSGVTLLDDAETVIVTITPPTLEPVEEEIETETELVGEDGEPLTEEEAAEVAEAQAEGDTAEEAEQKAESDEG
jgi:large subunit ribosomal protein L25